MSQHKWTRAELMIVEIGHQRLRAERNGEDVTFGELVYRAKAALERAEEEAREFIARRRKQRRVRG